MPRLASNCNYPISASYAAGIIRMSYCSYFIWELDVILVLIKNLEGKYNAQFWEFLCSPMSIKVTFQLELFSQNINGGMYFTMLLKCPL
jgi:hypothetical protein